MSIFIFVSSLIMILSVHNSLERKSLALDEITTSSTNINIETDLSNRLVNKSSNHSAQSSGGIHYYSGKKVTSVREDNYTDWFVVVSPGVLKRIDYEHKSNEYDLGPEYNMSLSGNMPAYFLAEDAKWYMLENLPLEFRYHAATLPMYNGEGNLKLGPEDFKPNNLTKVSAVAETQGKTEGKLHTRVLGTISSFKKYEVTTRESLIPSRDHLPQTASNITYYCGKQVTSVREDNYTDWFIVDSQGVLKRIDYEHESNEYDLGPEYNMSLKRDVPAYVFAEDAKWYKLENLPLAFRYHAAHLPIYNGEKNLKLRPDGFKPTNLTTRTKLGHIKQTNFEKENNRVIASTVPHEGKHEVARGKLSLQTARKFKNASAKAQTLHTLKPK